LSFQGTAGHAGAEASLLADIRKSAGPSAANTVRQLIDASFNKPRQSLIAQVLAWIFLVLGASGLFASLQDSLNAVWHVESTKGGWKHLLRTRSAAFGMIVVVAFLLLVTFVANALIAFVAAHLLSRIPFAANPVVVSGLDQTLTVALVACIFALIFKVLPDVNLAWRDVWFGAAVTAVLFVIGEALIALYIAYGGVASAYGAAGSILVALIWIYYSALILLFGAEFTKIHARTATLILPSTVRSTIDRPAGVDPRLATSRGTTETSAP